MMPVSHPLATGSFKTHQSMHDGVGKEAAIEISNIPAHNCAGIAGINIIQVIDRKKKSFSLV